MKPVIALIIFAAVIIGGFVFQYVWTLFYAMGAGQGGVNVLSSFVAVMFVVGIPALVLIGVVMIFRALFGKRVN